MAAEVANVEDDARMQIQDILEGLAIDEAKLAEPGNNELDQKIDLLDRIFTEYIVVGDQNGGGGGNDGKSVDVSQARLDIQAFSKLAAINHARIRRVAASNFTFRAADFANRIVRLLNVEEGSQSESLTENSKDKLDQMTQADYFNFCVPLRPILGAFSIEKREIVVKEKRQRQPRNREQLVVQRVQHKKLDEISEEDQNSKVAKQVEFIMDALKHEYRNNNKKPISYYGFVVDPTSFSNTIENIFYVSFLVKDGLASLDIGPDHLPTLKVMNRSRDETQVGTGVHKKQLIVTMEHSIWQELVQCLGLKKAAIQHNTEDGQPNKRARRD